MKMYSEFNKFVQDNNIEAMVVGDAPAFHPDYLRHLDIYKVLYSHDDPESSYQRNIPYLHAYHHVMYVSPAYTNDMDMPEKMASCGMVNNNFVPNGVKLFEYDQHISENELINLPRDIDVLYIGAFHWQKIELLVHLKKYFGKRFQLFGYFKAKHNLYMTARYRYPFFVRPVTFQQRVKLMERAKIGINIHNGYTVPNLGNERLYQLPANGVMEICDGIKHLGNLFEVGQEIVGYTDADDLVSKIKYYLDHEEERLEIALKGRRRVLRDYLFSDMLRSIGSFVLQGMDRIGWKT